MTSPSNQLSLESRFLEPPGWHWREFTRDDRHLRFGYAFPMGPVPQGIVVILPGLSEFIEKYFETAQNLLDMHYGVFVLDWMGQGGSGRYLKNPHKRHSSGFDDDIEDLSEFIEDHVIPAAARPDMSGLKLIMLGHSMGAHIGLRFLQKYPEAFSCAALSAPMTGIAQIRHIPNAILIPLGTALSLFMGHSYTDRNGDWREDMRIFEDGKDPFSSDPVRRAVHNAWCLARPALQVGHVTFGWINAALRSCRALAHDLQKHSVTTPLLIALAEHERIVDNRQTRKLLPYLPKARLREIPAARHEILMERDPVRNAFLEDLKELIHSLKHA